MSLQDRAAILASLALDCQMKQLAKQLARVEAGMVGFRPRKSRVYRARRGRVAMTQNQWTRVVLADSSRTYLALSLTPVLNAHWAWAPWPEVGLPVGFSTSAQFVLLELYEERHHDLVKYEWGGFNTALGSTALFVELTEV